MGSGLWSLVSGLWSLVSGLWLLVSGLWSLGLWSLGLWSLVSGPWSLVFGPWSLGSGPWSLVSGPWSLVPGPWSLVSGLWSLVFWSLVSGFRVPGSGFRVPGSGLKVRRLAASAYQFTKWFLSPFLFMVQAGEQTIISNQVASRMGRFWFRPRRQHVGNRRRSSPTSRIANMLRTPAWAERCPFWTPPNCVREVLG